MPGDGATGGTSGAADAPELEPCFACGAEVPAKPGGKLPDQMKASAGCWAAFGKVLRREYQKPGYRENHRLTVDAYTVQHPAEPSPAAARQIAFRLISLCAVIEQGVPQGKVSRILEWLSEQGPDYDWLEPPPAQARGDVTVRDVVKARNAESHVDMVEVWARSAWKAWRPHHDEVRGWLTALV